MKPLVGHLWGEDWNGFRLSVIGTEAGFRAIVIEPWDGEGRMCKTVYATEDEARRAQARIAFDRMQREQAQQAGGISSYGPIGLVTELFGAVNRIGKAIF